MVVRRLKNVDHVARMARGCEVRSCALTSLIVATPTKSCPVRLPLHRERIHDTSLNRPGKNARQIRTNIVHQNRVPGTPTKEMKTFR